MVEQKPLFRATLSCIADVSRNCQNVIVDKIIQVFKVLVNYMQQNIERDLKTDILKCFGDLALGMKKYTDAYIDTVLEICQNCF